MAKKLMALVLILSLAFPVMVLAKGKSEAGSPKGGNPEIEEPKSGEVEDEAKEDEDDQAEEAKEKAEELAEEAKEKAEEEAEKAKEKAEELKEEQEEELEEEDEDTVFKDPSCVSCHEFHESDEGKGIGYGGLGNGNQNGLINRSRNGNTERGRAHAIEVITAKLKLLLPRSAGEGLENALYNIGKWLGLIPPEGEEPAPEVY